MVCTQQHNMTCVESKHTTQRTNQLSHPLHLTNTYICNRICALCSEARQLSQCGHTPRVNQTLNQRATQARRILLPIACTPQTSMLQYIIKTMKQRATLRMQHSARNRAANNTRQHHNRPSRLAHHTRHATPPTSSQTIHQHTAHAE